MVFVILMGVTFSQVHTYVKTYQNVHFKYVQFIVYKLFSKKKKIYFLKKKKQRR